MLSLDVSSCFLTRRMFLTFHLKLLSVLFNCAAMRSMGLADAMIAATALIHQLPLVTHNTQDFQWISGLELIDPLAESSP